MGGGVSSERAKRRLARTERAKHDSRPRLTPCVVSPCIRLSMLSDSVRFVGPSINCEGASGAEPGRRAWTPHVQSYAVATDAAGLEILRRDSAAFHCHGGRLDAIREAEVGASSAMMAGGHNLASFQLK